MLGRPPGQSGRILVVTQVLVAVGDHRAPPVPPPPPHELHLGGEERVRRPDHRADVQVVLPVLDGHVELVPAGVQVGDDRLEPPVAETVHHVAPVALGQQIRIEVLVRRPRSWVRSDAYRIAFAGCRTVHPPIIARRTRRSFLDDLVVDPDQVPVGVAEGHEAHGR